MSFRLFKRIVFLGLVLGALSTSASHLSADDTPLLMGLDYANPFGNYFVISGFVDDEDPEACIVGFDGILEGYSVMPESDGYFYLVVQLEPEEVGWAEASAFDAANQESNLDGLFVSY